jgi:hypothetical protein
MRLDPAAFRPGIGVVVVANIGDQQALPAGSIWRSKTLAFTAF